MNYLAAAWDTFWRSFSSLSDDSEEARARYLYSQWVGLGLTDVHLSNHTVLLSLPGSTPNTITDKSSHQCFLPNGIPCDQRGSDDLPKQQFSYAAYSAVGSLQGEVVDVQYGSVDDLRRAKDSMNLTNQIAVVKLGQAPLLYKLSLLSELGFGGVLPYIDPCDAPPGRRTWHQTFRVTLNPGGNPAIGYTIIKQKSEALILRNLNYKAEMSGEPGGLTSLLVQPISAFLAKTLLSSPSTGQGDSCIPLAMPPNTERKKITLTVGNQMSYKKIYNVVGYLKGRRNPVILRRVLILLLNVSRHDSDQGGGASAIMNQLIAALTEQTKRGWVPDRTTVFCSWGGSALGNIGSYEWGKDNSVVLKSSAVAYVSLNSPVRGTETLRATASPTLLQLTSDIQRLVIHPQGRFMFLPGTQAGERLVAGSLPTGPGRAQPEMATWARLPVGSLTTRRKVHEGVQVQCGLGSSGGQGPRRPNPWTKTLAIGTWNVTSLGGKEPELVREVERYRLEIVGLTSTHSLGSGTQLLERGWTLHYSGVAQGERRRAGVGLLIAPQLSRHVLEFTPVNERVASLRLRVGDRSLAVVCAYGPNSSTEYLAFLESLGGVLDSAPGWGLHCSTGGLQRSCG
ncbi:hypothetical protein L3Q82_007837 [Scortum barcoo]|uniref:Uncharacterized protein n=1 Tax=Scortum barcoo TaxID=214431 RepID=A0ACB8WN46_9TELE|nr:hypothetical protein L3Q82_007837 [Scortum barcoo]